MTSRPLAFIPVLLLALAGAAPAAIVELARALKGDPDLIYEYVRNNIKFYPVWGIHKGAVGAILDKQGRPSTRPP